MSQQLNHNQIRIYCSSSVLSNNQSCDYCNRLVNEQHKEDKNSPIKGWGGLSKMSNKMSKMSIIELSWLGQDLFDFSSLTWAHPLKCAGLNPVWSHDHHIRWSSGCYSLSSFMFQLSIGRHHCRTQNVIGPRNWGTDMWPTTIGWWRRVSPIINTTQAYPKSVSLLFGSLRVSTSLR